MNRENATQHSSSRPPSGSTALVNDIRVAAERVAELRESMRTGTEAQRKLDHVRLIVEREQLETLERIAIRRLGAKSLAVRECRAARMLAKE